jgi:hypothetical protein
MRIIESQLRSVIRNIIKEELTNDFEMLDFFDREYGSSTGPSLNLNILNYEHLVRKYVKNNCHKGPRGCSVATLIEDLSVDKNLIEEEDMKRIGAAFTQALHDEYDGDIQSFVR